MAEARKAQLIQMFNGATVNVTLSDDRLIRGKLECLDSGRNLILGESFQIMKDDDSKASLGYVMIPGQHVRKVELYSESS